MNSILTLLLLTFLSLFANAQSPELLKIMTFEGLENTKKQGYGSKEDPILSGAFINVTDRTKMVKLKSSYRWPDGTLIDFNKRFSTASADGKGIVDCYILVKPGTTDTVKLFVNPYKESTVYYVPKGLKAVNITDIKTEIAPLLKLVEEMEESNDAFTLKNQAAAVLTYINATLGTTLFTDSDQLKTLMADKEADPLLKSFLLRAYIFNKFYAYGKSIANEKAYAFNKVKENFQEFIIAHPEVKTGGLKEALEK